MYVSVALLLRSTGGFALSMVLAWIGLILAFVMFRFSDFSWPGSVFITVYYSGAGVGAGLGAFLAWFEPEWPRPRLLAAVALFVLVGVAGAWAGYYYKAVLFKNPAPFSGREIPYAALWTGVLVVNIAATLVGVVRHLRTGWR